MYLGVLFRKFTYNVVLHLYTMCKILFRFQIIIQLKEATKTLVSKTMQYPPRCISCLSLAHVAKIAVYCYSDILNHCRFSYLPLLVLLIVHTSSSIYQYNNCMQLCFLHLKEKCVQRFYLERIFESLYMAN